MRWWALVYALIPAAVVAAAGLAYFSYTYSSELSGRERQVVLEAMAELGTEKVVGVESEILRTESGVLDALEIHNLRNFHEFLRDERPAIQSVAILDEGRELVPGGLYTRRSGQTEQVAFRDLLETRAIPDLPLERLEPNERTYTHARYDGHPYLFSYGKHREGGENYYIILEADISYLVGTVFPQYFGVASPHLYQVADEDGDIVYGHAFAEVPEADVVEVPFRETLGQWTLRVTRRDLDALAQPRAQEILGLSLTGLALAVIVGGLGAVAWTARQERRANQLKSDFISNVSHELKTPLSIITMFGELLATGRARSEAQKSEYAEIIRRESVRLTRLIDNVLDFAKMERGREVYEFAEADPAEVTRRALELCEHRLESAEMELRTEIEDEVPRAELDVNAFTLAILNLVDNAAKYARSGGAVTVALRAEGKGVVLEVRDYGPGVPEDEKPQLFERFYRARDIRLKPIRGSGIGLALVKHIAHAHGGTVDVENRSEGAAFRIWIPGRSSA